MNGIAIMLAKMLLKSLGFANGAKTGAGIASILLGLVVYAAQHFGIEPAPIADGAQGLLNNVLDWARTVLIGGGTALTLVGAGHKMGKVDPKSVR